MKERLRASLDVAGPLLGLLVVIVLFGALAPDRFLSAYNLKTVLTQTVIVGLGAVGMTYVMIAGGIDLSGGSGVAPAPGVTAALLRDGHGPLTALAGLLVTRLGIVQFIVTLGTMGVARGLAKWLADEQTVRADAGWLGGLMTKTPDPAWLLLAKGVWITLGLAALMTLVLRRTVLGVHVFAVGSSEAPARL